MTERLIAIETSSPRLSLALGTDTQHKRSYQGPLQWRHAESVFEGMEKLLAAERWDVQSLTGVLVSIGPGSFTGIRIGLAVARALGQALEIPVRGFSSLEILAYGLLKPGEYVCPVIDALRGEVFTGLYTLSRTGGLTKIWKACRIPVAELSRRLAGSKYEVGLAGDALSSYKENISGRFKLAPVRDWYPRAEALWALGRSGIRSSGKASYKNVLPMYLRRAAAQERVMKS